MTWLRANWIRALAAAGLVPGALLLWAFRAALFGPGTWGAGGNMVAWVICGALAFGWQHRENVRLHSLRVSLANANHQASLALARQHHAEALERADDHHEALAEHVTEHVTALRGYGGES